MSISLTKKQTSSLAPNTADGGIISSSGVTIENQPGASEDVCFFVNDIDISGGGSITINNLASRTGTGRMNIFIDQLVLSGGSRIIVNSNSANPIFLYVSSKFDASGGSITNAPLNDQGLYIIYTGNDQLSVSGGTGTGCVIISTNPAAPVDFSGGSGIYGAVYAAGQFTDSGGGAIHYDRALERNTLTVFNFLPHTEIRRIQ